MKGLKPISFLLFACTIGNAYAELTPLNESSMRSATGQAGLTIDVNESLISIGEIDYKDEGFLAIKDVTLTGADLVSPMDNIRLTFDVAGSSGADLGTPDLGAQAITNSGGVVTNLVEEDQNAKISDGDLVIAIRPMDDAQPMDYGMHVGSIELGASTSTVGAVSGGTVIIQDWNASGNIAGIDMVIDNGSDGFNLSVLFNAAGEITVPFVAASASFNMHNSRGVSQVTRGGDSFAHFQMNVGKGETAAGDAVLALDIQDISGDIDITNIQLGSNGISIGNLYVTDLRLAADTLIYGH